MKFTDKFTFLTTSVVLICIALVLVGGAISLRALSLQYHQNRIDGVIHVIESQLDKHIEKKEFDIWLPDLLDASGVVRLQIKRKNEVLYQNYYESRDYFPSHLLLRYEYQLEYYPDVSLILQTHQPYSYLSFSIAPLVAISATIILSLLLLIFSVIIIKRQFRGAELLEKRAHYILQNNPTARVALPGEWPQSASKALDMLADKLDDSKKVRSYFDAHIRGKAFLDETTGIGNSLAYENQLDVIAVDQSILSSALLQINFSGLGVVQESEGRDKRHALLLQITELLTEFVSRYSDPFCGRVGKSEFAIILPQISYEESKVAAKQLTKLLLRMQLPEKLSMDDFFYVGVVNFYSGEKAPVIMEELKHACLVARHQKTSGWFLADQEVKKSSLLKGTVRWRSLLERILRDDGLMLYHQQVMLRDGHSVLFNELWPRIIGFDDEVVDGAIFLPMAEKCGLREEFDLLMIEKVLALLVERGSGATPITISVNNNILTHRRDMKWFTFELMQLSRELRKNLVIEVSEQLLASNDTLVNNAIIKLQKIGCKIAVTDVGKAIVNTSYIVDLCVDYLKIHPGLIRDIHLREINQTALQSLMASCISSAAKVIAVGIESPEEWRCLLKLGVFAGQGSMLASAQSMRVESE